MNIRRLQWVGADEKRAIQGALENAALDWLQGWSLEQRSLHLVASVLRDQSSIPGRQWFTLGEDVSHKELAWIGSDRDDLESLCAHWIGFDASPAYWSARPTAMSRAISTALTALLATICDGLGLSATARRARSPSTIEPFLRPWSGAVVAEIQGDGGSIYVAVAAEALSSFRSTRTQTKSSGGPSRGPLVPISRAVATEKVSLALTLQDISLSLEELASLEIGDVLKTSHSVYSPIDLKGSSGMPIAGALLGSHDCHRAIQIVSTRQNPEKS